MSVETHNYKRQEGNWYPVTEWRCGRVERVDGSTRGRGRWRWWLISRRRHSPLAPSVLFPPNRLSLLELWISWRQIVDQTVYFGGLLLGKDCLHAAPGSLCSRIGTKGISRPSEGISEHFHSTYEVGFQSHVSYTWFYLFRETPQMQQGCSKFRRRSLSRHLLMTLADSILKTWIFYVFLLCTFTNVFFLSTLI